MNLAAELKCNSTHLKIFTTQPLLVVYTGNCLPQGEQKDTFHRPYAAILLETSQLNDAINHRGKDGWPKDGGVIGLGDIYEQKTVHKFSFAKKFSMQNANMLDDVRDQAEEKVAEDKKVAEDDRQRDDYDYSDFEDKG